MSKKKKFAFKLDIESAQEVLKKEVADLQISTPEKNSTNDTNSIEMDNNLPNSLNKRIEQKVSDSDMLNENEIDTLEIKVSLAEKFESNINKSQRDHPKYYLSGLLDSFQQQEQNSIESKIPATNEQISQIDENFYISNQETAENLPFIESIGITHIINLVSHLHYSESNWSQANTKSSSPAKGLSIFNEQARMALFAQSQSQDKSKLKELKNSYKQKRLQNKSNSQCFTQQEMNNFMKRVSLNHVETDQQQVKYLCLSMRDLNNSDISFFVYSTIEFIEAALKQTMDKAKILIHCYQGNSRSATILAAYFMWKRDLTVMEALDLIRSKRKSVDPNLGFVGQLIDFHTKIKAIKASLMLRRSTSTNQTFSLAPQLGI